MPLLECQNLVKDYPGMRAVDGVNFSVNRGEVVVLLGPNGAGKTTSFRMTCGLVEPTEGRVILDGTDVSDWPLYRRARRGLGYLPQDDSVFGKLTVAQNLQVVLEYLGISRPERLRRIDELLEQFGLGDRRGQVASTLSGGERRRLEIARCLTSQPSLILLDEPFAGIDPVTINSVQDIIANLCDSGIAVLLTDHREQAALSITNRAYVLFEGKVLVSGTPAEVLADQTAQEIYFGREAESTLEQVTAEREAA